MNKKVIIFISIIGLVIVLYLILSPKLTKCNYDKDCNNDNCCNDNICGSCPKVQGPPVNNQQDPKIRSFMDYLQTKMEIALQKYVSTGKGGTTPPNNLSPTSNFGLGIYIKNTPGNRGSVKVWRNYGGSGTNNTSYKTSEPNFYFGSGTKPLTCMMVVSQLYKVWRKHNPNSDVQKFITWYAGNLNQPGAPPAVTYSDLFKLTNGFENSNFTETLTQPSNTQVPTSGTPHTQKIQEWLFCCDNGGLMTNCSQTGIFCDNTCSKICPVALDHKTYGGKCASPFCPDFICDWAWYSDYTFTKQAEKDPNTVPFRTGESCECPIVRPNDYQNILQNLSIFDVSMMRSGIPDSDSIWGIDTAAQLASRTSAIGPVQFVSEIIGFDWNPLWTPISQENYEPIFRPRVSKIIRHQQKPKTLPYISTLSDVSDISKKYTPITKSLGGSIDTNSEGEISNYPVAQYSSSAYTFLGILLWLLYDNKKKLDWTQIDLNQLLPREIRNMINFAGTIGNNGDKYFSKDEKGNKYYSFEKTVTLGDVVNPGIVEDTPITTQQTDINTGINAPVYKRVLPIDNNGNTKEYGFVDWDSSSGLSCGNGWGKCSDMAEIYMNILSPTADNPIIGDKKLQKIFTENFTNYNGSNLDSLYNNRIRAPWCLGANAWSQDMTYNSGVMGPDWFGIYDDPNSYDTYGMIPCYGHLGATYGFNSGHAYFPPGKLTAWEPYKNDTTYYSDPNWSLTFDFCGGNEFTISQAHNNSNDDQSGAIQYLIAELVKDPFNWSN